MLKYKWWASQQTFLHFYSDQNCKLTQWRALTLHREIDASEKSMSHFAKLGFPPPFTEATTVKQIKNYKSFKCLSVLRDRILAFKYKSLISSLYASKCFL